MDGDRGGGPLAPPLPDSGEALGVELAALMAAQRHN